MTMYSHNRSTERATNRIRLVGLAALAICMIIAITGLLRHQQTFTPTSQSASDFWATQP